HTRRAEPGVALEPFPPAVEDRAVHSAGLKKAFELPPRETENLVRRSAEARPDEPPRFLKGRPLCAAEDPNDEVLGVFSESDPGTVDDEEPPHHTCLEDASGRRPEAFEQAGRGLLCLHFAGLKIAAVLPRRSAAEVPLDGGDQLRRHLS